jgi:hypothetical protein
MREDITHRSGQIQLSRDGHEVLPIRAQAVQPDDTVLRFIAGLQNDWRGITGHFFL